MYLHRLKFGGKDQEEGQQDSRWTMYLQIKVQVKRSGGRPTRQSLDDVLTD